jgi:transposase
MTQDKPEFSPIPPMTVLVAHSAFPKGNVYMTMRDQLGVLYRDSDFVGLFSPQYGRPPLSPGQLALITLMQFAEGLTDRQAAEAVRSRIDWKYALSLELTDAGFDFSVLSEFRDRLIAAQAISQLLDDMLKQFKERKLLKIRGRARTDSTHVVAAIRQLNRIECVGETLRHALNDLATVAPCWLKTQVNPDWFERYGKRFEQYRLPKDKSEQLVQALTIGADGHELLSAVYADSAPEWLRQVESVEILRQVWLQQYYLQQERLIWREKENLPPCKLLIQSPYDPDARNRTKRTTNWTGYTVHLSETCDLDTPNLITHVETTPATTPDGTMTATIHQALAQKQLLPKEHFVDTAYIDAQLLVSSDTDHKIDLVGRVPPDSSWLFSSSARV